MGVLLHPALRLVHADHFEKFDAARGRFLICLVFCVQLQRLIQLIADRKDRIQRCHRVLEDDAALVAAEGLHLTLTVLEKVLALVENFPFHDTACLRQNLHDGISRHGFSGAGLADHPEHLSLVEVKGNAVDRLDLAVVGEEGRVKILHGKNRNLLRLRRGDACRCICVCFCHFVSFPDHCLSLGSNASRIASPRRLKARTIRTIITAGNTSRQGADCIPERAVLARLPREGIGRETPRPRKDR